MDNRDVELAQRVAQMVAAQGGTTYYIGGYVRDRLRGQENKDVDIEVHGITPAQLADILDSLGGRMAVGESFGIYRIRGYDLDIAMPRREEANGRGHRDFEIFVDPNIGTYKAALRRDFTVNAILQNVLTGEIIDHFGGIKDIQNGIIRHVNEQTFAEDPLRVLRAAQFAARFGYTVAADTVGVCRSMDLSELSSERVLGELEKALLKSDKPSVFFEVLRQMHQLDDWFCELSQLIGVQQNPKYHAEGDVWVHTMMVLDEAAAYREKVENPLGFMLGALTHDFGKAISTREIDGEIRARNHETEGLPLVRAFLRRLTNERELIRYVLNLVELHMKPNMLAAGGASVKATNKMFDAAIDPEALICLSCADGLGKRPVTAGNTDFLQKRLAVYREYMSRPYVSGKDLLDAGLQPSPQFSEYLAFAHKLRLAGVDKSAALRQTLAMGRTERKSLCTASKKKNIKEKPD